MSEAQHDWRKSILVPLIFLFFILYCVISICWELVPVTATICKGNNPQHTVYLINVLWICRLRLCFSLDMDAVSQMPSRCTCAKLSICELTYDGASMRCDCENFPLPNAKWNSPTVHWNKRIVHSIRWSERVSAMQRRMYLHFGHRIKTKATQMIQANVRLHIRIYSVCKPAKPTNRIWILIWAHEKRGQTELNLCDGKYFLMKLNDKFHVSAASWVLVYSTKVILVYDKWYSVCIEANMLHQQS